MKKLGGIGDIHYFAKGIIIVAIDNACPALIFKFIILMHIVWKFYIVKLDIPLSFLQWIHDGKMTPHHCILALTIGGWSVCA